MPALSPRNKALPLPTQRALSRELAAAYLDLSPNTFDRLVADRLMPKPVQFYGRKVWDVRALDAAFDAIAGCALQGKPVSRHAADWDD